MKRIVLMSICGLGLLAAGARPEAHHAFSAEFDPNKTVKLEGTVVQMEWTSPHAWLTIDVQDQTGAAQRWSLEFGPPNALFRRGWRKTSLMTGMKVTVTGFQAKDGRNVANADKVTLPDGSVFGAGTAGNGAPTEPDAPAKQ
jgi:hypothetical protein